jgi:ketosteroid isomerase-like protein
MKLQTIKMESKALMLRITGIAIVSALLSIFALSCALSQVPSAVAGDSSLQAFFPQFEEGTHRFINGNPNLWKQNASQGDDATIMGGWGAYEKGWKEVGRRYDWAAGRFRESGAKVKVEYLSSGVSGDLAYTVAIERSEVRLVDQDKPAPMALRVTHIFRKENGVWKLVHRHADPLINKTAPATVLQK